MERRKFTREFKLEAVRLIGDRIKEGRQRSRQNALRYGLIDETVVHDQDTIVSAVNGEESQGMRLLGPSMQRERLLAPCQGRQQQLSNNISLRRRQRSSPLAASKRQSLRRLNGPDNCSSRGGDP